MLTDRERHARMTEALRDVKAQLGTPGASAARLTPSSKSSPPAAKHGGMRRLQSMAVSQ